MKRLLATVLVLATISCGTESSDTPDYNAFIAGVRQEMPPTIGPAETDDIVSVGDSICNIMRSVEDEPEFAVVSLTATLMNEGVDADFSLTLMALSLEHLCPDLRPQYSRWVGE